MLGRRLVSSRLLIEFFELLGESVGVASDLFEPRQILLQSIQLGQPLIERLQLFVDRGESIDRFAQRLQLIAGLALLGLFQPFIGRCQVLLGHLLRIIRQLLSEFAFTEFRCQFLQAFGELSLLLLELCELLTLVAILLLQRFVLGLTMQLGEFILGLGEVRSQFSDLLLLGKFPLCEFLILRRGGVGDDNQAAELAPCFLWIRDRPVIDGFEAIGQRLTRLQVEVGDIDRELASQ